MTESDRHFVDGMGADGQGALGALLLVVASIVGLVAYFF